MISERDKQTAHAIATLLGVELEPWQDFVLQHMLAGYRRPDPPAVQVVAFAEGGASCNNANGALRCGRTLGHEGQHGYAGVFWPAKVEVRGPYGTCDEPYPEFPSASCKRARGHTGPHEAIPGPSAGSVTWLTKQACGEQMPAARIPATCAKPAGHPGKHVVGAGDLTGSMWYSPE